MHDFVILTDSTCDLSAGRLAESGVYAIPMHAHLGDADFVHYPDYREMDAESFYSRLRSGEPAGTAAISPGVWMEEMEKALEQGKDVLTIVFSSALSSGYGNARMAAQELAEKYPERKIFVVDSLSACTGEGLAVLLAAQQRDQGKSAEETAAYLEENKLHVCHWFTVDDLEHLHRGGRVGKATAVVGQALGIKPVMHVDNEGRLVAVSKARGRKNAIKELAQRLADTITNPEEQEIFISHAASPADAQALAEEIQKRVQVKKITFELVGPVIGTHSGPGTLALFFVGKAR